MNSHRSITGVGVVIARFQVHSLTAGQLAVLRAADAHERLIVLLGCSTKRGTKRDPLTFQHRADMVSDTLAQRTSRAVILPIHDWPSDQQWSAQVDSLIETVAPGAQATLYHGRDSFQPHYSGRHTCVEVKSPECPSGTECRAACVTNPALFAPEYAEAFREGAIYTAQLQFPATFPTVDVAVLERDTKHVLVGRKRTDPGGLWRFPGGFVDPTDASLEMAMWRELREEVGAIETTSASYIGSTKVDDWRYRGPEGIMTTFFAADFLWGAPKAADDLEQVQFLPYTEKLPTLLVPEHRPLADMLLEWLKVNG
jgi:bifunctional NMN adenylyltransferase/nudix hydrolase